MQNYFNLASNEKYINTRINMNVMKYAMPTYSPDVLFQLLKYSIILYKNLSKNTSRIYTNCTLYTR